MRHGKVQRSYLGLAGQVHPVSRAIQRQFGLPAASVVQIHSLEQNGPAYRAGLREGDLIVALNGEMVATVDDIHRLLVGKPAGSTVALTILRDGAQQTIRVTSGER